MAITALGGEYGAYAHRCGEPLSSRPLSPCPYNAAAPKAERPGLLFLRLLLRAWLTQPHDRRHKAPPPPCALTTNTARCHARCILKGPHKQIFFGHPQLVGRHPQM